MKTKRKPTAGERMIESARQALAFAKGTKNHGCEVHVPDDIDVKAIREKISLSQSEFAKLFGLSKRTLEHWEHGASPQRPCTGLPDSHRA
jgi:putative transcriptional regulator